MIVITVYQTAKSPAAEFSWIEKLIRGTRSLATTDKDAPDTAEPVSWFIIK